MMKRKLASWMIGILVVGRVCVAEGNGDILRVPHEYARIQDAVDAAADGDTVLVEQGTYHEAIRIAGKSIVLASRFLSDGDRAHIEQTVLHGALPSTSPTHGRRDQVILVEPSAGPDTRIVGFTIRGGDDGITCHAQVDISHNQIVDNVDGIDYENGGGTCMHNIFRANLDDAIDLDDDTAIVIADNLLENNHDDGIEIRLHPHGDLVSDATLRIEVIGNVIRGNMEDGIQIIDYPGKSQRHIRIERNLIVDNAMAGIGFMSDGVTAEDFRGAHILEPVEILNNTFARNAYGICGGGNVVAANNVIVDHRITGLKRLAANDQITHTLLWNNRNEPWECEGSLGQLWEEDPQLDSLWHPLPQSPCLDRGATDLQLELRCGSAPELGAYEMCDGNARLR